MRDLIIMGVGREKKKTQYPPFYYKLVDINDIFLMERSYLPRAITSGTDFVPK